MQSALDATADISSPQHQILNQPPVSEQLQQPEDNKPGAELQPLNNNPGEAHIDCL